MADGKAMKTEWRWGGFLAAALAANMGAACKWQPPSAPASEESAPSAPGVATPDEILPEVEVLAGTDSVKVSLQVYKATVKSGEPFRMRVVFTNAGSKPLMVPFGNFEYLPGLFTNSFGLKLNFRTAAGEDLSGSVGSPMDGHPPLDCMNSDERESLERDLGLAGRFGVRKGGPPSPLTAKFTDSVVWLDPGESVSTPEWAYQSAAEKYCRRLPPPKPVGQFAELPSSMFLPSGRYVLSGSGEMHVGGAGQEQRLVAFAIPQVELRVLP